MWVVDLGMVVVVVWPCVVVDVGCQSLLLWFEAWAMLEVGLCR